MQAEANWKYIEVRIIRHRVLTINQIQFYREIVVAFILVLIGIQMRSKKDHYLKNCLKAIRVS